MVHSPIRFSITPAVNTPSNIQIYEVDSFRELFDLIEKTATPGAKEDSDLLIPVSEWAEKRRRTDNVRAMGRIFVADIDKATDLDIDTKLLPGLVGVSCFIYSTWSHGTPDKGNCLRAVIELDREYPAKDHARVFEAINRRLDGLIDPQTKNIDRCYYLPGYPAERADLAICEFFEGEPLRIDSLVRPTSAPTAERQAIAAPSRDDLRAVVCTWAGKRDRATRTKREQRTALISLLDGQPSIRVGFGERNDALIRWAGFLAAQWPMVDPLELAKVCDGEGWEKLNTDGTYPIEAFAEMIERMQAGEHAKIEAKRDARAAGRDEVEYVQGRMEEAIEAVVPYISTSDEVYERGGSLVRVVPVGKPPAGSKIDRQADALIVREISDPTMASIISGRVSLVARNPEGELYPIEPPPRMVPALLARGDWGARPLTGIAAAPVLHADGTCAPRGYDPETGWMSAEDPPNIPERPAEEDTAQALDLLLEVVEDFPFAEEADRSAALAAILTPPATAAFPGPSPLFVISASTPGTGKSLLADVVSTIGGGHVAARTPFVESDDEMRKRILALALAGDQIILIDNTPSGARIGWSCLDAALTSGIWQDRILGKSERVRVPFRPLWLVTANNPATKGDLARRAIRIRIDAVCAYPEQRSGFKHHPLLSWIRQERPSILGAAFTVLRAYIQAGRPGQLTPLGSFEGWSDLVRGCVVWLGLADPLERVMNRDEDNVDPEMEAHCALLMGMERIGAGLTARELLNDPRAAALHDTLVELCGTGNGKALEPLQVGDKLRTLQGRPRVIDGRELRIVRVGKTRAKVVKWGVR